MIGVSRVYVGCDADVLGCYGDDCHGRVEVDAPAPGIARAVARCERGWVVLERQGCIWDCCPACANRIRYDDASATPDQVVPADGQGR